MTSVPEHTFRHFPQAPQSPQSPENYKLGTGADSEGFWGFNVYIYVIKNLHCTADRVWEMTWQI